MTQWFGLGTSMLEVSSSKPLASESKGFVFWVELVAPGLLSAEYLSYVVCKLLHKRGFYPVRSRRVAAAGFPCHKKKIEQPIPLLVSRFPHPSQDLSNHVLISS